MVFSGFQSCSFFQKNMNWTTKENKTLLEHQQEQAQFIHGELNMHRFPALILLLSASNQWTCFQELPGFGSFYRSALQKAEMSKMANTPVSPAFHRTCLRSFAQRSSSSGSAAPCSSLLMPQVLTPCPPTPTSPSLVFAQRWDRTGASGLPSTAVLTAAPGTQAGSHLHYSQGQPQRLQRECLHA